MTISKVERKNESFFIFNEKNNNTGKILADGITYLDFSPDFIIVEKEWYFITFNSSGERLAAIYTERRKIENIGKDSFTVKYPNGEVMVFDRYCKLCGDKNRGTNRFDARFKEIEHFAQHPHALPFVGKDYGKGQKILILGESHYLDPESNPETINNWYSLSSNDLNEENLIWTNTSLIVNNTNFKSKGHLIYKNVHYSLINCGVAGGLSSISYMNFFQRPADSTGNSISVNQNDTIMANNVLKQVLDILSPDYLYFVSSKSYNHFDKGLFPTHKTGHGPHPACPWWNKKSANFTKPDNVPAITGKESFQYFIKTNLADTCK
jgi:hypothetical protein